MIKKFFSYYKPHKKLFIIDLICSFVFALTSILYPILANILVKDFVPNKNLTMILLSAAVLLCTYLLQAVLSFIIQYWGHVLGVRIQGDMRSQLFSHLERLPFSYFDDHRTGSIMSRMVADLFEIAELAHHGPEDVFISIVTIIGTFIFLCTVNPFLALIILAIIPFMVLFAVVRRNKMTNAFKKSREKVSKINASIESSISGIRVAKAYTAYDTELKKFEKSNSEFKRARGEAYRNMGIFFSGMGLFRNILHLTIMLVGGLFCYYNYLDTADFIAFALSVFIIINPIMNLVNIFEQIQDGMTGFKRFREIMDVPKESEPENPVTPSSLFGDINFSDVTFSYKSREGIDGDEDEDLEVKKDKKAKNSKKGTNTNFNEGQIKSETKVLKNLNINIKKGTTVAFVGPSGGGKTTMCNLIPRFYEVDGGVITINGYDITTLRRDELRRNIGIVAQDVFLFAGSIKDNIKYGNPDATDEEVMEAGRKANIHEFIMTLPLKYDTEVGERGVKLSGGQKQRVSIARAFLKNPPILILDEATSALDNYTEMQIQSALEELSKGRTTIVVAHRLSTVKNADEIIVITGDGIQERGKHDELVKSGGYYAQLYSFYKHS